MENKKMPKLKRDLMPARLKKAKKDLEKLSHDFVRRRDSINDYEIKGHCIGCKRLVEGSNFQSGHFIPSGSGGALLRYFPTNMNGQCSACNCGYNQEMSKILYSKGMIDKYGQKEIDKLLQLKNKTIKADILFYEKMIELYKAGDQMHIEEFLVTL